MPTALTNWEPPLQSKPWADGRFTVVDLSCSHNKDPHNSAASVDDSDKNVDQAHDNSALFVMNGTSLSSSSWLLEVTGFMIGLLPTTRNNVSLPGH